MRVHEHTGAAARGREEPLLRAKLGWRLLPNKSPKIRKTVGKTARRGRERGDGEDLPFRVELWDEDQETVVQVLAVTANAGIGQAAFYAAAREFPERYVTLRHQELVINRWNGSSN